MNIFVTDPNPRFCACALDDLRLNKMILETAQILSTTLRYLGDNNEILYRPTHVNHPCCVWARELENRTWLFYHFWYLCWEYEHRREKKHACALRFEEIFITDRQWRRDLDFCNCTPYKDLPVFEAYRLTLKEKWEADHVAGRPPKWTNRGIPLF